MSVELEKAKALRAMHRGKILVLPNAWDVASARVIQQAGFGAIATTSAGIAFTMGYPDGQRISREEMLAVVGRIASAVKVPVTADVEAGYGIAPEDAARTARDVLAAGAVGMNLEDATGDPENPLFELSLQVERIRAVRELPIVLNARTDVYLLEAGTAGEALRRSAAAVGGVSRCGCGLRVCSRLAGCGNYWAAGERLAMSGKYSGRAGLAFGAGVAETGSG